MNVSIVMPSLWRIPLMRRAVQNIIDTSAGHQVETIVVAGDDDTYAAAQDLPVVLLRGGEDGIARCNIGAAAARGEWLIPWSDDHRFNPNWATHIENTPNSGFVGMWEGRGVEFAGTYAITRACACDVLGGVLVPPVYRSWWADQEACAIVQRHGRYAITKEVVFIHHHYTLDGSPDDATYASGRQWHAQDGETFKARKAQGFPITWQPVLQGEYANSR